MLIRSEVRLFLSVDVVGSTHLKNIRNHQTLIQQYKLVKNFYETTEGEKNQNVLIDHFKKITSEDDFDWADIINTKFTEFNNLFSEFSGSTQIPWKGLGDELIYSINIENRLQIHENVSAFLKALRTIDKRLVKPNLIRLKASGWTAGFPVRNRKISLPFPELVLKNDPTQNFDYPRIDFVGPEMDIGFRLGKNVWPGLMVVSLDLAQLLGEANLKDQLRLCWVGWDKLKGVWNGKPYPIIWATLSDKDLQQIEYNEYEHGSEFESKYIDIYIKSKPSLREAKEYVQKCNETREQLENNFGFIKPYIVTEDGEDKIPEEHREIISLLKSIQESPSGIKGNQNPPEDKTPYDKSSENLEKDKKSIEDIFNS